MAPRKVAEKPGPKNLDLKPKRGVRKRTPTAKCATREKLKSLPIVDSSMINDNQDSEDVLQETTKGKLSNKVNINKVKHHRDVIRHPDNCEHLPLKKRKIKAVNKPNHDEETIERHTLELENPKKKKRRASRKQNQQCPTVPDNDVTEEISNLNEKPSKVKKVRHKQKHKKKHVLIADDASSVEPPLKALQNAPYDVPLKIKKAKTTSDPSLNDIKMMLANEVVRNAFKKKTSNVTTPIRPGRPKKTLCPPDQSVEESSNEPNEMLNGQEDIQDLTKKKAVKNVYCRKNSATASSEDVPQVNGKSPVRNEIRKRKSLSLKRKTVIDQDSQSIRIVKEGKKEKNNPAPNGRNTILFNSNDSTTSEAFAITNKGRELQKPRNISCRKNSGTSTSTCFSWTKDISSSSTTTCITVKSSDFVRIDNKIPIVKLTNVDHKIKGKYFVDNIFEENSCDTQQEKSKCPSECSSISIGNLNVTQTLNLSTSSLTSVTTHRTAQNNSPSKDKDETIVKLQRSLENLTCKMKNFDLEMVNWIGYENENKNPNIKNFHARIFDILREENEVLKYCKEIKRVLIGDQQSPEIVEKCQNNIEIERPDAEVVENLTEIDNSKEATNDVDKHLSKSNSTPTIDQSPKNTSDCNDNTNKSKSFDENIFSEDNDDDDALSLYAESISGLESSKRNSSYGVSNCNDKNINKQPELNEGNTNKCVVQPTRKPEADEATASNRMINRIEKQTADSSTVFNKYSYNINSKSQDNLNSRTEILDNFSITSDLENCTERRFPYSLNNNRSDIFQDASGIPDDISYNCNNSANETSNANMESVVGTEKRNCLKPSAEQLQRTKSNKLALDNYQMPHGASTIFKGICHFNIGNICRKANCNFLHKVLDLDFVRNMLQVMSEEMFIQESMYLLKWYVLRGKYGICYIEECIRRNLTIWLLRLLKAYKSNGNRKSREQETFEIEATEATLLHLNDADFESCGDMLRATISPNMCMCDHLMMVISETQNFSRFKKVFIKLTTFIFQNGRMFVLDVATQLLERLCILPYDKALSCALMKIIAKTNPSIFSASMMGLWENQLLKNNKDLYKELMGLKMLAERCNESAASPPTQSPHVASSNTGYQTSPVARADSPDTTHTDYANKTSEPVITRTITINRTINTSNLDMSVESESSEEPRWRYTPREHERAWRKYPHNPPPLRSQRFVYNRPSFKPRGFRGTFPKFRRRPHQDPY